LTVAGTFLLMPGLLLVAAARGWGLIIAAMVPLALGSGLLQPSLHALLSRRCARDEQGGILGLNHSVAALARVLGPTAGGWLFQSHGVASPYFVGAALTGVALVACALAVRPGIAAASDPL
jgi:MFS family permease